MYLIYIDPSSVSVSDSVTGTPSISLTVSPPTLLSTIVFSTTSPSLLPSTSSGLQVFMYIHSMSYIKMKSCPSVCLIWCHAPTSVVSVWITSGFGIYGVWHKQVCFYKFLRSHCWQMSTWKALLLLYLASHKFVTLIELYHCLVTLVAQLTGEFVEYKSLDSVPPDKSQMVHFPIEF